MIVGSMTADSLSDSLLVMCWYMRWNVSQPNNIFRGLMMVNIISLIVRKFCMFSVAFKIGNSNIEKPWKSLHFKLELLVTHPAYTVFILINALNIYLNTPWGYIGFFYTLKCNIYIFVNIYVCTGNLSHTGGEKNMYTQPSHPLWQRGLRHNE